MSSQPYPSAPPPAYSETAGAPPQAPPQAPLQGYAPQGYPPPQGYAQQGYQQPAGYHAAPQGYGQPVAYNRQVEPDHRSSGSLEAQTFNASSFSDKAVRHRFIKKVYLIVTAQMLFTLLLILLFLFVDEVRTWVQRNMWFYIVAYVTFLITYIVLVCCPGVRRKYPGNYIALSVFTVMFAYVAAAIASYHTAQAVAIAAGITAFVALAISLFAIQTKIDFTMCSGLIFAASITLLVAGFVFMFVAIFVTDNKDRYILQCVYGTIAALIISLFLVFDTQRIVGGKNRKYALDPEEHVIGAMELYLDIVYLFLIILACFGSGD